MKFSRDIHVCLSLARILHIRYCWHGKDHLLSCELFNMGNCWMQPLSWSSLGLAGIAISSCDKLGDIVEDAPPLTPLVSITKIFISLHRYLEGSVSSYTSCMGNLKQNLYICRSSILLEVLSLL